MDLEWYKGEALITTYELDELLATKLRALYQRKKGRDLFDLWYALNNAEVNVDKVIKAFRHYMNAEGNRVTQKEFIENIEKKIEDAVLYAKDLKDRYTVLWLYYNYFR